MIEQELHEAMEAYTLAVLDDEKSAPFHKRIQDAFLAGVLWERTRILKAIYPDDDFPGLTGDETACVEEEIRRMREEGFDGEANEE